MQINQTIVLYSCVLLIGVFISAVSQIMLKKAANKNYDSWIKEYLNPLVVFAYALFVLTTFLSIFAYKGIPLSMGPILEASGYIFVTVLSRIFLKEHINIKKFIGLSIIVVGIIVYSF